MHHQKLDTEHKKNTKNRQIDRIYPDKNHKSLNAFAFYVTDTAN